MSLCHKLRWLLSEHQELSQRKKAVGRLGKEILSGFTVLSVETISGTHPLPLHVSMEAHCSTLGQHARSLPHRQEALATSPGTSLYSTASPATLCLPWATSWAAAGVLGNGGKDLHCRDDEQGDTDRKTLRISTPRGSFLISFLF